MIDFHGMAMLADIMSSFEDILSERFDNASGLVAVAAGLLSFFSPCVLPLIPAYVCLISGLSLEELTDEKRKFSGNLKKILLQTILFILGFSLVFIAMGASANALGKVLHSHLNILRIIGGIVIIIFGLHLAGLFNIKFLQYEKKIHIRDKPLNFLGSFLVGAAFAFGWTPCVGPILGGILLIAATKESLWQGVWLLSLYSLGLAIPFLITSLAIGWAMNFFSRIKKHFRTVQIISGVLLVLIGIVVIAGGFELFFKIFG